MKKKISDDLVILTFNGNYSDEFDVDGFLITEKTWWEGYKKEVEEKFGAGEREYGFGTNEHLSFDDAEDYFSQITELAATQEEIHTIQKVFGTNEFGIFPVFEFDD